MAETAGTEGTTVQLSQPNATNQLVEQLNLMNNCLYLHPSENPVVPLVSPALDSTNYHSWSMSIITALSAKNEVEFVLGTCPCPLKNHPTYSAWHRCNNMVVSWLVHSISIPIRQSIVWMGITLDIWNDLKSRFSQGDLSRISYLQMGVAFLHQGELTVTDYFTKLRIIWDELENFRPNLVCICETKCSCSIAFTSLINQRKCEDQAMQFLRGLNEQYHNIKSHVLLMEPIPPITIFFFSCGATRTSTANNFLSQILIVLILIASLLL